MPQTTSAKKRLRHDTVRRKANHSSKSRVRTFIKKFEKVLEQKVLPSAKKLEENLRHVQKELFSGAQKGVFHKRTASRKFSRLCLRLNKLLGNTAQKES